MSDEDLDQWLEAADNALTSIAGTVDVEAGLGAIVDHTELPPEAQRHKPERGRVTAEGRSTVDGTETTLQAVHEPDGAWTIHYGVGGPGVTLSRIDALWVAESILEWAHLHGEGA